MKRGNRRTPEKISNIRKEESGPSLKSAIDDMTPISQADITACPYCGKKDRIRYGKKRGKQRFLCKECRRTFLTTTNTVMNMSHYDIHIWNEVLGDILCGSSMSATEKRLGLSHQAVFHMRHKLLALANDLPGERAEFSTGINDTEDGMASSADVFLSKEGLSTIPAWTMKKDSIQKKRAPLTPGQKERRGSEKYKQKRNILFL